MEISSDGGPVQCRCIGVRLRRATKIEFVDPSGGEYSAGDFVVVETIKGAELAQVVVGLNQLLASDHVHAIPRRVIRRATEHDLSQYRFFRSRESDALIRCRERVERHRLPMKLLIAEFSFDGSRLTFYFSSDGRVDFRDLVRDLASTFRTRIDLRQIGPRDETKLLGGVARCGRCLCCSSWLRDFAPVSMKMAKNQDLPLTDSRLSGICGRLMCCLAYENAAYSLARQHVPCSNGESCSWGITPNPNFPVGRATCPRYGECVEANGRSG